jgi:ATP-dependent DNA helicase RecQ
MSGEAFLTAMNWLRRALGPGAEDEVHCISDWGYDFRPNYRRIMRILRELPPRTAIIGTTATANTRVVEDVSEGPSSTSCAGR